MSGWLEVTEDGQLVEPQTNPLGVLYEPPYGTGEDDDD